MGIWFQDFARIENCETIHEKLTIRFICFSTLLAYQSNYIVRGQHLFTNTFIYRYVKLRTGNVSVYRQKDAKDLVIWSRVREANPWDNFIDRLYVKKVSSQAESKLTLCDYP